VSPVTQVTQLISPHADLAHMPAVSVIGRGEASVR
jgi:hypothetical protein